MSNFDFSGKVALVTGGGSGIGEACSLTLARSGAKIVVADLDQMGGERVVQVIQQNGGDATFVKANVTQPSEVEAMVDYTIKHYGGLQIAVNNAGIAGELQPTATHSIAGWQRVIDVNLNGVFYCMRYELPCLLANGGGVIINIASILGSVGFASAPGYVAAKHGVVGLTKAAAIEYSGQGIRINAVGPGFIRTPLLTRNLDETTTTAIAQLHPIGRLGEAQEVANLVAFLCSETASFITGGYYVVDGAYTAQ